MIWVYLSVETHGISEPSHLELQKSRSLNGHFLTFNCTYTKEPAVAHKILLLIGYQRSRCSGEPAQSRQSIRCSHIQSTDAAKDPDQN